MTKPLVRSDSLGGSPLARAARAGELGEWFKPIPANRESWKAHASAVRQSVDARWYDSLRDGINAHGAAATRIEAAAKNGIVVTTGQQPGLFGGPLLTLIKAITARALADQLQETLGIPVAPLFWAATDDADFDETSVVSVALDGGARELRLHERAPTGTPVARIPLGQEIDALATVLRDACGSAPHASYLDAALSAYRDGATIGSAYVELLRHVLEPLEIAVLDVSHASVTRASTAIMQRAASRAERAATAVRARSAAIATRGMTPQVDEVPGLSLVFHNAGGTKRRLSIADCSASASLGSGEFLSATVLLRPVLERALLPTAAYVAGPGEMAYFAQVTAVADALELPQPLVVPRWSATIVEPRVQRILDEFDITADAFADPHAVETTVAKHRVPSDAMNAMQSLRGELVKGIEQLRHTGEAVLPKPVVDGLQRSIEHRLERAERRMVASTKRRESEVMHRLATARGSLYPHGVKQERKLAYIPFLARYGEALVRDLLAGAAAHARSIVGVAESRPSVSTPLPDGVRSSAAQL